MNNERRKQIKNLIDKLEPLRDEIETLKGEEEDYFDNMLESLQSSEKGEKTQGIIDALDSAFNDIENAINSLVYMEQ